MEQHTPLWTPSQKVVEESNLTRFMKWLLVEKNLSIPDYDALWNWSVQEVGAFWDALWHYFNILHSGKYGSVTNGQPMPHTQWFEGAELSYAEHIFRHKTTSYPAIISKTESGPLQELSWQELEKKVAALRHALAAQGVQAGDRVAAYISCIPEATIAFLAVNSLGAVWSSCSPDFGTTAITDRFAQIKPKVLIAVSQYQYGGKLFDKTETVNELLQSLPTVETVVLVDDQDTVQHSGITMLRWRDLMQVRDVELQFTRVPFNHPIWILYSSGTTGLPKAIVHSVGGILMEQLKYGVFHNDYKPGDRCFWYTTTGWMMWNHIHSSLLAGATMVLYDGSAAYPNFKVLWKFAETAGIHHFGTSAGYILANMKAGITPGKSNNLSALRAIGSTGSTLPPEGFEWIYREVKADLWLASASGGTDVCSAFVGGNPHAPVYAGEIQCRALGCKLESFNEAGVPVVEEVGEMVITEPMPSMPIYFWNDPLFERYTESYFEMYPGVWRHGDWMRLTRRQTVIIYGRSDATLNRGGVRIGTSEIYRAVDKIDAVKDSLVICLEQEGGKFWMPLFVVLQAGISLTPEISKRIATTIRSEYSPRHVPDEIIAVPDIPYTISGKKTETPVKKVLMGMDPQKVVNVGSLKNPSAMDFFIALAEKR